ncbi:3'-phosphoesterase [Candidatus Pacearchaeota archaeon ex4484_71]|nr:MAG: 3'-phosphoesterase [Candidatus Pacearchaeota archaeon ex4484_71]
MSKFVVHENNSDRKYWILRLEIGGVLKSWVLPKNPLLEEVIERIANKVPDRSLEYLHYEGELFEENYGLGEAKIMDSGDFDLISNGKEKIDFELFGSKFKGKYCLKKIDYGINPEKSWLLIEEKEKKEKD